MAVFKTITLGALTVAALAAFALPAMAAAKKHPPRHDGYPNSIMQEEQGTKPAPRMRRRGSSSPSPVPPYQSTVTRPGVAPKIIQTPRMVRPASPPTVVPGQYGTVGPAIAPARPAGQSFGDRTINCIHSGSGQGIGAGQIGAFTQSCVNN